MTLLKLAYATQRSLWWRMVEFPGAAYDMFNDGSLVTLCEPLVVCFTATDYDDYGNYRFCPLSLWNLWLTALNWWLSTISYVELPERFQLVVYDVSCFPSTCLDGDFPQVFWFQTDVGRDCVCVCGYVWTWASARFDMVGGLEHFLFSIIFP